jgi:hypothetical protein
MELSQNIVKRLFPRQKLQQVPMNYSQIIYVLFWKLVKTAGNRNNIPVEYQRACCYFLL